MYNKTVFFIVIIIVIIIIIVSLNVKAVVDCTTSNFTKVRFKL